ncbi:hypothetical protein AVEN_48996-1 [Araneus ventricosus]|uniref:Uncharacterized protein n=1 Tax=Araneus ventricosus TaxID=182803 RepID=A0A4Y2AIC5_ARAVE|nr:hypothetical protein AVEN_48996-1 [Araneus ventricosus]
MEIHVIFVLNFNTIMGRGGIVVESRPRSLRAPGSKPHSHEDPSCLWAQRTLNPTSVKLPPTAVVRKFGEGSAGSGSSSGRGS